MNDYVTQVVHLANGNYVVHLANGNYLEYVNCDGTWFTYGKNIQNEGWKYKENKKLWKILSSLIHSGRRVRIWYGDTETGRSWNEEYEVTGTLGRSAGKIAFPLLIKNSRSCCGGALLDDFIIRIDDIKEKRTIYKSDNFHVEDMKVYEIGDANYKYQVAKLSEDSGEWEVQANFKTEWQAHNYVAFMRGERYRI